jgi:hypothetical protein
MQRRSFLRATVGATLGAGVVAALGAQQGTLPPMTVYKSASCGCCKLWVDHARTAGFTVKTVDLDDLAGVKRAMGIPARLASCHTVVVGSYVLEGHVPAADVKRLLAQKPKVRGLAVPGMPVGSPGMEQGSPANYDRYDVISFTTEGTTAVFASHGPPARGG